MNLAVFENVGRTFKARPVFAGLDFALRRGGRYALLGPNGAGKSTLLRLLCGALRPDSGRVLVGGREAWREGATLRKGMGILAENAPLLPELTVLEHLELAGQVRGLGEAECSGECERLAAALNLSSFLKKPTGRLSIGQKRRAALAAACMGGAEFLLLDEPSAGLDPEEARRLAAFVRGLPPATTLILSTHILSEAHALADEFIVLAHGRLAAKGPWADFLKSDGNDEAALRSLYLKLTAAGTEC